MRRRSLRALGTAAATVAALLISAAPAQAAPVAVFPGMEIHQDNNLCTLGYVDPNLKVAFTAGHCRGSGNVTDKDGNFIGGMAVYRDNTPDGSTVSTTDSIFDYEGIGLANDAMPNNVLPGGRVLVSDPTVVLKPGEPVCHFGVTTGESCGTVEAVNNGWFTMTHGIVSQKGDSGGPVYVLTDDGRALLVGLFNSTWGNIPAAVSWQAIRQQASDDVRSALSAQATPQPPAT
ncbi:hypothetical protein [Mycobacterium sp.]|uniref:Rv1815 family serine proteinase n=1 Tax=Mycobacterium sp. TaxID=1785 RepID=UPI002D0DC854|nr:hypothetical protein [Mycobacterium sp.]HME49825.1 hypothetical protein [Mycobacterium sp.]